jgi:hypothetical protein
LDPIVLLGQPGRHEPDPPTRIAKPNCTHTFGKWKGNVTLIFDSDNSLMGNARHSKFFFQKLVSK